MDSNIREMYELYAQLSVENKKKLLAFIDELLAKMENRNEQTSNL